MRRLRTGTVKVFTKDVAFHELEGQAFVIENTGNTNAFLWDDWLMKPDAILEISVEDSNIFESNLSIQFGTESQDENPAAPRIQILPMYIKC